VRRFAGALVLCCAASTLAAPPQSSDRVILATTVSWTDADGRTGSASFQGNARGRTLTGILQGGGAEEVRVRGTIERDGRITGSLTTPDGAAIGTFSARVDERGHLDGTWLVDGASGGALTAPADALPLHRRHGSPPTPKTERKPPEPPPSDVQ
jgi:hypothetical protein